MKKAERTIKNLFQKMGILVKYYSPASSEDARRVILLKKFNIDTVLDVGANQGQYALDILYSGYKGKIISFEPLSEAYNILNREQKKFVNNWIIAPRCAIGAENTEIEINISENSVSSSILNVMNSHLEGASDSRTIGKEKVNLQTLDYIAEQYINPQNRLFLKIDVQGYESEVLKGGAYLLKNIQGIEIEISMIELYENQKWLFSDVMTFMKNNNFSLYSLTPAFTNKQTGRVLQYNGIFFKD